MEKRRSLWGPGGFLFTAALGTALHFLYGWTGENPVAAAFSAVNESTGEHMKLLFVPVFLWTLIQLCLQGQERPNLTGERAVSLAVGLAVIPVAFYTYRGVLGFGWTWADISIFYLADLALFLLDGRLGRRGRPAVGWQQTAGLAALWALAFAFVWCTFRPPHLGLWRDPVTGGYGIV